MADNFRVIIIGAGLSGLLLCQALKRQGIQADVYEGESEKDAKFQDYRLGLLDLGQSAVRDSLSAEQGAVFDQLLEHRENMGGLMLVDPSNCEPMWDWANVKEEPKSRMIPRSSFREFLLQGLESQVHYSKSFKTLKTIKRGARSEVIATFSDGTEVKGDLLVGCDGANSRVKDSLGLKNKVDTNVKCLMLHSPLSRETVESMPSYFVSRYWVALLNGFAAFISTSLPDSSPESTNPIDYDHVDWQKANLVVGIFGDESQFAELEAADSNAGQTFKDAIKRCCMRILEEAKVDERILSLFRNAPTTIANKVAFNFTTRPSSEWSAAIADRPVMVIGDALHAMPPTRGIGGNTALADACDLAKCLANWKNGGKGSLQSVLNNLREQISERGFKNVGSSVFWIRQYLSQGQIFSAYQQHGGYSRLEMERDTRFGFKDNASPEAISAIFASA